MSRFWVRILIIVAILAGLSYVRFKAWKQVNPTLPNWIYLFS